MMTLMDTELVGRVELSQDRRRVKDRLAAVVYGRSPKNRYRKESRLGQWIPTLIETWAHDTDRCVGESLRDDEANLLPPPHARPKLVRAGALAAPGLPGGFLVERLDDLGDPLARAVVCQFLGRRGTRVWYGIKWLAAGRVKVHQVMKEEVAGWVALAGSNAVNAELDKFRQAVGETISHEADVVDFLSYLGSGPLRDVDLARAEYQRLSANNSAADIRRYLEVYGYVNPSGTVGRWSHKHLHALRSDAADQ